MWSYFLANPLASSFEIFSNYAAGRHSIAENDLQSSWQERELVSLPGTMVHGTTVVNLSPLPATYCKASIVYTQKSQ
jgi:hypothetical protein